MDLSSKTGWSGINIYIIFIRVLLYELNIFNKYKSLGINHFTTIIVKLQLKLIIQSKILLVLVYFKVLYYIHLPKYA